MKRFDCSFGFECSSDVPLFLDLLKHNGIKCIDKKFREDGDLRCIFETDGNFMSRIRYLGISDVEDLHVIFETLNFTPVYTGKRDKALLKKFTLQLV